MSSPVDAQALELECGLFSAVFRAVEAQLRDQKMRESTVVGLGFCGDRFYRGARYASQAAALAQKKGRREAPKGNLYVREANITAACA